MEIFSKSEKQTYQVAKNIADSFRGGEIIGLVGDLGSGKTTFTKGIAQALGIKKEITSPTFAILKEYSLNKGNISKLVHVDAYRLKNVEDAKSVGIDEVIQDKNTVTIIEWPKNIRELLPAKTRYITFEYVDEKTRKIQTP